MIVRAGVVGTPIEHSLSPILHRAAYTALGLTDWSYDRIEADAAGLPGLVAGLGGEWRGLSVTMPGKEAALAASQEAGDDARLCGAANTLIRRGPETGDGWRAENTDVVGIVDAFRYAGVIHRERVEIVGSGATARSALVAVRRLGVTAVRFVVRREVRPETLRLAQRLGFEVSAGPTMSSVAVGPGAALISTVPAAVAPVDTPAGWGAGSVLFDVSYAPWPTPLAAAAKAGGGLVISGGSMLLYQAVRQVELMTGREAPVEAMRAALSAHLDLGG